LVFQGLALGAAAVVILLAARTVLDTHLPAGEFWFLLLCSVAGTVTLVAARDLVTLVVALEVVTLPAFALVGLRRYDGRSSEAALKFFLIGVVSTAVMLFGISLVYGVTGQVHLQGVAAALNRAELQQPVTAVAVALTLVGFTFKVSAVPFHFWTPDTYAGAPVPVAAYLSVVSKAAGFAGLILVVSLGFRPYLHVWGPMLAVLAALTMSVGNLVALRQQTALRLLAWSSIAQAGYMLVPLGVARASTQPGAGSAVGSAVGSAADPVGQALSATVAYLLAYAVMNLGAFAVVVIVARHRPENRLSDYRGLVWTEPLTALSLAFFLLCLAGLPPGLIGLFAKVVVFQAAVEGGVGWLAVVMAVNTVIALYYYLYWTALLFARRDPEEPELSYRIPVTTGLGLGLALGAALLLSVLPQLVLQVLPAQAGILG
ncbi:NADH-quinone oxidoreductase subunit N, partial [Carbonactinospora thermoautotrophica]